MAVVKYLIHNVTKSSVLDPRSTVRSAFSWICVRVFLGLAGESVNEAHVGEHAIFIFGITELSEQLLDILLGDLISKVAEDVVKLSKHHGAVAVFVVELEELNIVVVGSLGVRGGNSGLDLLDNIIVLGELLALLISLSLSNTGLLGDVQAKSIADVSEEEQIDFTFAIPVVDVADILNLCFINHFENELCLS